MKNSQAQAPRAGLVALLLMGVLFLGDHGMARASDVDVTVQVNGPECAATAAPVSFLPGITDGGGNPFLIDPALGQITDSATIGLSIMEGQTVDCALITGQVTFTESGYVDPITQEGVNFLSSSFECDGALLTAAAGSYTCGQGDGISPISVLLTVTATEDAVQGYYDNTISFTLVPVE